MTGDVTLGALRRFKQVTLQSLAIASNNTSNSANPFPGFIRSYNNAVAATSGGGQTNATAITAELNRLSTVTNVNDSVKLPASLPGMEILIYNSTANSAQVFGNGTDTINSAAASTGVPLPAGYTALYVSTVSGAWLQSLASTTSDLPAVQFVSAALTSGGTFAAGQLTGANAVYFTNTTASPSTVTTRTASQMFSDIPNAVSGETYSVRVAQGTAGALTIGAGTGVTITGTAAISTVSWRDYTVVFTSATSATFQNVGGGLI